MVSNECHNAPDKLGHQWLCETGHSILRFHTLIVDLDLTSDALCNNSYGRMLPQYDSTRSETAVQLHNEVVAQRRDPFIIVGHIGQHDNTDLLLLIHH